MNIFVLDCSVAAAWCFEDEFTSHAQDIFNLLNTMKAVVPNIWPLEISNVLCMAERHGRISADKCNSFLDIISSLAIELDMGHTSIFNNKIINLTRHHMITAYDAAYLELALRYNVPLASFDKKLCAVAKKEGIKVL
ncbi:MAG TPA: type II toxin-antitoxin system VapC family toxin [Gammaproteobacteria bacterium]|nr:type II toxin-antitoxin system VapC family toxin [Gammaproteobacteria bacterium]